MGSWPSEAISNQKSGQVETRTDKYRVVKRFDCRVNWIRLLSALHWLIMGL